MSAPVPTPVTFDGRVIADPLLERAMIAAVVRDPRLLSAVPGVGLAEFNDAASTAAWTAIRNLEAAGQTIDGRALVARLEQDCGVETVIPNAIRELLDSDHGCTSPSEAIDLGDRLMLLAARREMAIRDAERIARERESFAVEVAKALADVKAKLGASDKVERNPLFFDARELFNRDYQSTQWLVTGLVTVGGVAMFGGEPKAAIKTWSATELAIAVVTGTSAFGEYPAKLGRVFYFYAEDADRQVRNRIRAVLAGRGLKPDALEGRLFCCPRGQFIDVVRDEDLAWIVASARRSGGPVDLLVLDPLRDISSAAEDKSDEMAPVMRRLRLLGELLGCTVLVIHHTAKASESTAKRRPGQRLRGSGAIHGSVDSGFYISEAEGDGASRFSNLIESEIKGARGAGRFGLELSIVDDENGEAIRATWQVSRQASKAVSKSTARQQANNGDDATMLAFVRRLAAEGVHLSRRGLRDHDELPIPDTRAREALDRLIHESGSLRLVGPKVHLREHPQGDTQ